MTKPSFTTVLHFLIILFDDCCLDFLFVPRLFAIRGLVLVQADSILRGLESWSWSWAKIKDLILLSLFANNANLTFLLKEMAHSSSLLAHKWQLQKFLLPVISNLDRLLLDLVIRDSIPLLVGKLYDSLNILRMDSVPDIEHVVTAALPSFWISIWEILGHTRTLDHHRVKIGH